jgi:hypothetical protein
MWMKIGSNDITAQVPGVSQKLFSLVGTPKITRGSATRDFFRCLTGENNFFRLSSYCTVIPQYIYSDRDIYVTIALCSKLLHRWDPSNNYLIN